SLRQHGRVLAQARPGMPQRRQRVGRVDGPRRLGLGQLLSVRTGHQWQVRIAGHGYPERVLEEDLPAGGIEQVRAADHVGDALVGIVHHHGELVGPVAVSAAKYEVAYGGPHVLHLPAADQVVEGHAGAGRHTEAHSRARATTGRDALVVDAAVRGQVRAAALAFERVAG